MVVQQEAIWPRDYFDLILWEQYLFLNYVEQQILHSKYI